jgi:hypothetical protein
MEVDDDAAADMAGRLMVEEVGEGDNDEGDDDEPDEGRTESAGR